MLAILPILFITLLQVFGYRYIDKKGWNCGKLFILLLFIPLYLFVIGPVFISYYIPKQENVAYGCGVPVLRIFLFFVFFGIGGLLLTHFVYWMVKRRQKK